MFLRKWLLLRWKYIFIMLQPPPLMFWPLPFRLLVRENWSPQGSGAWSGFPSAAPHRVRRVCQHCGGGLHHTSARGLRPRAGTVRQAASGRWSAGDLKSEWRKSKRTAMFVLMTSDGCQVDPRNVDGSTPLCEACSVGSLECVRLLLERGAKANPALTSRTASPLHEACMGGKCFHCTVVPTVLGSTLISTVPNFASIDLQ